MTESFRDNYREELTHLPSLYLAIIEECFFILYLICTSFYCETLLWCVLLECICKTKLAKRTQMLLCILFLAIQIINNVSLY